MRRFTTAALLALVACSPAATDATPPSSVTPSASAAGAPSAAVVASPSPTVPSLPVEHMPRLILSVPYAPSVDVLGATTARVGGLSPVGATTFAVDEQERVYVWDRARLRVVVYQAGKFVRAIELPYVEPDARSLLVDSGRLYFRYTSGFNGAIEYEIDATTGRLLRAVRLGASLYPRVRAIDGRVGLPPTGQVADASGNGYLLDWLVAVQRYRRVSPTGETLAYAVEPLSQKGIDLYVRADGALYELASDYGGVGSAYVYALIPAIAGATPTNVPPTAPVSPVFGARSVPDQLVATVRRGGSVELDDAARTALWWLASTGVENAGVGSAPGDARFEARWSDGFRIIINADGAGISDGQKSYLTPTRVWGQLAGYAAASPARISMVSISATSTLRIADLAETERALTPTEVLALRASLGEAFSVAEGELPGDLELPFPVYEITIGDVVVQLRRDRYASVSRFGAFAHNGSLYDLARHALPVPTLSIGDPRSLFLAERVTIEEDGFPERTGDITRWKASLVRALTGIEPSTSYGNTSPLTLTFAFVGGRTERVRVMANAYTYRGTTYARSGIIGIVGYRGVP